MEVEDSALNEQSRDENPVEIELKASPTAISREERVIYDLAGCICTGYTIFMRVQAWSYCYPLSAVLSDAQARGELLSGFRVRVREDGLSLHLGDDESVKERGAVPLCQRVIAPVMMLLLCPLRLVLPSRECCLSLISFRFSISLLF